MAGEKIFEFDRKCSTGIYDAAYYFEEIKALINAGKDAEIKAVHKRCDDDYWRDSKAAIRAEKLGDPDKVIAWAQRMARDCEKNGRPMVTGKSLERVFVLRLARGSEKM